MPGPPPQPITSTPRQRQVLERMVRRETSTQQQVRRARVVLAAAEEANNEQIGRQVGVTEDTARTWRRRWAAPAAALLAAEAEGDDGALAAIVNGVLADEPRSGAPARFTPEPLCQLMAVACAPPGDSGRPLRQWTPRELDDEAGKRGIVDRISARTVGRVLVSGSGRSPAPREPRLAHPPRARSRGVGGADRDRLYGLRCGPDDRRAGRARGQHR